MEEVKKTRIRRTFDKDFKLSAIQLVLEGKQKQSEVARDLGISENTLHKWKKEYLIEKQGHIPTGSDNNNDKVDMAEYRRVLKENKILKEQRDILKKAVTFFSQQEE